MTYCIFRCFPNVENQLIFTILLFTPFTISCICTSNYNFHVNKNKKLEEELIKTKNILEGTNVPELIEQKKKLNEIEINKKLIAFNKINQNEVIKISRICFEKSIKALRTPFIYLKLSDFHTLEIYDNTKTNIIEIKKGVC